MAFEFEQTNLTTQKTIEVEGFSVSGKLTSLDETQPKKILKVVALPRVNTFELVGAGASYSGVVNLRAVYVSSTGETEAVSGQIEWQSKCEFSSDMSGITLVPRLSDLHTIVVENGIAVSGKIELQAFGQSSIEAKKLIPDETIVTKTEKTFVKQLSAQAFDNFNIVEDFSAANEIEDVLVVYPQVAVKNVFVMADAVAVEGECLAELLCKTDAGIVTINKTFEFKQEVACLGAKAEQFASAQLWATSIDTVVGEKDDEKSVNLTVNVGCVVSCFNEAEFELVTDVFSVEGESNVASQGVSFDAVDQQIFLSDTISATINIAQFPEFDELKTVLTKNVRVKSINANMGKTDISGEVEVDVAFVVEGGELLFHSAVVDFNIVVPAVVNEVNNLTAQITSYKIRGTHDLELLVLINVAAQNRYQEFLNFVSSVEVAVNKDDGNAGILMYIVKEGEDLFDIGRALKVRPEQIIAQNDNVENITAGDRIFVYLPQKADF